LHKDSSWQFPGEDQVVEKEVGKTKKRINQSTVTQIQASCITKHSKDFGG
jgi:hypothetical protein